MRIVRGAGAGLLLACLPIFSMGCASLSSKLSALPSIARNRANVQYQAAQNAEQRGQWQKARELYMTLQRNSPNNPLYSHRMGVVCTQLRDFECATKFFEHARSLDPHNGLLLSDMGYSAYLQKDYGRAETLLAEAVRLRSDDARAVNNLAMSIGFQRRYEESLLTFRRVNNETQSLLNVAYIHAQLNEPEAAIALYQQVLVSDPMNRVAINALQQLKSTYPAIALVQQSPTAESWTEATGPGAPAPLPPLVDEQPIASDTSGVPPFIRPVIISATDAPPPSPLDFQPPLITPFNSSPEPSVDVSQNAPRQIEVDPADTELRPARNLPPELAAAPKEISDQPASKLSNDDWDKTFDGTENVPEPAGPESEELTGLEWAKPELSRQAAAAKQESSESVMKNDGFRGFCPVAIRDERRLRSSHAEFSLEFQGHTYRFSSAEALIQFQEHPDWYVPVAEGMDIIEMKRGQTVAQGSLDFAVWFRHRLHMFSSAENLAMFRADPRQFLTKP